MASPVGRTPYAARRRRPRWLGLVFLALLVVPIVEIAVIIAVGRVIGGWPTLFLLLAESLLGAWLVRREGRRAWQALSEALRTGTMPSRQLSDAALVLIGGTLLLTPGFVTDIAGFFLILPPTRPFARRLLERAVSRRLLGVWSVNGPTASWTAGGSRPPGQPGATGGPTGPGATRPPAGPSVVPGEVRGRVDEPPS